MLIPAGSFEMGKTCEKHGTRRCGYSDPDICFGNCPCTPEYKYTCDADEKPVHQVTITRDFYMMESEVTQGLYQSVMGNNPSKFSRCGSDCPVERVSWFDAVRFANKLSQKEGLEECYQINGNSVRWSNKSCNGWRLPTEAEWEYAGDVYFNYAGSSNADAVSWTKENSRRKTHKVCGKKRNGYELCDMSGNVNEWVWDWYGAYSNESQSDPTGVSTGSYRVYRGGSWNSNARDSRVSDRISNSPMLTNGVLGFRLGRTP
jgi:formylglycine-generating enzyme required for sulfatase activity